MHDKDSYIEQITSGTLLLTKINLFGNYQMLPDALKNYRNEPPTSSKLLKILECESFEISIIYRKIVNMQISFNEKTLLSVRFFPENKFDVIIKEDVLLSQMVEASLLGDYKFIIKAIKL